MNNIDEILVEIKGRLSKSLRINLDNVSVEYLGSSRDIGENIIRVTSSKILGFDLVYPNGSSKDYILSILEKGIRHMRKSKNMSLIIGQ